MLRSALNNVGSLSHFIFQWKYIDHVVLHDRGRCLCVSCVFNCNLLLGTPVTKLPVIEKQPLDLYTLFRAVCERGGIQEVYSLFSILRRHVVRKSLK